jgi:hypothetical protein
MVKSVAGNLAINRAIARSNVRTLCRQAETLGFRVYPATQRLLAHYVTRALVAGKIAPGEAGKVSAALLASAMEIDHSPDARRVDTRQLKRGWYESLAPGPGNCAPHECASTIISRFDSIRDHYATMASLLDVFGKK